MRPANAVDGLLGGFALDDQIAGFGERLVTGTGIECPREALTGNAAEPFSGQLHQRIALALRSAHMPAFLTGLLPPATASRQMEI